MNTYDLNVDSTPGKHESSEEKSQAMLSKEPMIKCRYVVVFWIFVMEFFLNTHRVIMGVSIVAMVNNSALHQSETSKSQSCVELITNSSDSKEHFEKENGEFLWSPELQGYILGIGYLCYTLATIPAGKLAELFGGKNISFCALFLSSLFTIASPIAAWHNVYLLIIAQGLAGLFQAGFFPGQIALIANWCPISERGSSYTIALAGESLGAAFGSYISGLLCGTSLLGGWPLPFLSFGGFGVLASLLLGWFLYDNPSAHRRISPAERTYILQNQENVLIQRRPPTPWRSIFTSIPVYALACGYFGQMWAISHFFTVHPTFLGTILHYPIEQNGLLSAVPFLLRFLTTLLAACLFQIFKNRDYMSSDTSQKFWNTLSCLGYSGCLLGMCFSGCNRSVTVVLSIISLAFMGFGDAGCWITAVDMTPTFAASVNAVACVLGYSAEYLMPLTVAYLTNDEQTIEQWNKILFISIGIVMSSGLLFAVFGSAKIVPWNEAKKDEKDAKENSEL